MQRPHAERRFRPWMALPPAVALATALLALAKAPDLETFEPGPLPWQERIASVLREPAAAFGNAARLDPDWHLLDPGFARAVQTLCARMEARGFEMTLLEGYRSPERQATLAASGRTPAGPFRSLHQYGLAADLGFVRNGRPVATTDPWAARAYEILGLEAGLLGLTWGGAWARRDLCHVEATLAPGSRPWLGSGLLTLVSVQERP